MKRDNRVANLCEFISIIIYIISLVYLIAASFFQINGFISFSVFLGMIIMGLSIYALGKIIEQLNKSNESNNIIATHILKIVEQNNDILDLLKANKLSTIKIEESQPQIISEDKRTNNSSEYRCICTTVNKISDENCSHCGRPTKVVLDIQSRSK